MPSINRRGVEQGEAAGRGPVVPLFAGGIAQADGAVSALVVQLCGLCGVEQQAVIDLLVQGLFEHTFDHPEITQHAVVSQLAGQFGVDPPTFPDQTLQRIEPGAVKVGEVGNE